MRVGMGYDVHRLTKERKLILGGVEIPHTLGLLGHSDADVAVHAVMDALLGAAALGDIGKHFPDTDDAYEGISSLKLLAQVGELLAKEQYLIENIDVTIVAQKPKLRQYIAQMEQNIAHTLHLQDNQVNIKATTEEGLGFTGTEQGIAAYAVCALTSLYEGSFAVEGGCCRNQCSSERNIEKA
ncbi:MAG: 2-C-methyl-D-erythritol 2,4-cyclodiphosphate synthase [Eubacterium sp.]|nr:2-C-methyl-D-erythritol 2,4-cyclodiphosphate synthase [Eubacterium sp.]